jgi:hypothetical protein
MMSKAKKATSAPFLPRLSRHLRHRDDTPRAATDVAVSAHKAPAASTHRKTRALSL